MKPNLYIPALTGIRAIAAFLVFFHHFNQLSFPYPIFRVLNEFHFGVTIFFVLSGFLIYFRYFDNCKLDSYWFKNYLKNRVARIYPIYLILTIATFLVAIITAKTEVFGIYNSKWTVFLMNVFFVRGFFDDMKFTGISQGWSLTVEECFYFSAPFFFILLKKSKNYFFYLPVAIISVGILLTLFFSTHPFYSFFGNFKFLFLYTFLGRCCEFFLGMYLANVLLQYQNIAPTKTFYTVAGAAIVFIAVIIMSVIPLSQDLAFGLHHPFGMVANNLLLPIGVSVFFYGLITEKTVLSNLLGSRFFQVLGKSSYIFYLIHIGFISQYVHQGVVFVTEWLVSHTEDSFLNIVHPVIESSFFTIIFVFIILNFIAYLLWHFIEEPMNLYIRKSNFLVPAKHKSVSIN